MDLATVGRMVGAVHHGTKGWYLCRDILVSNSLLGWRNGSLNSSLTALVGEDTQRAEVSIKALQVTGAETNPSLGSLSLKHPQEYFGRNERHEPWPASNHPCVSLEPVEAPGDEQSLPFGEGWIFIANTVCPGDVYKVAVGETN